MEQGVYPPDAVFDNLPETMDFDLMDELLSGGCWLETANGATDFLQPDPSSTNFFEPFYFLPSPEISNNPKPPESNTQEETKRLAVAQDPPSIEPHTDNSRDPQPIVQNIDTTAECSSQVECHSAEENSELRRRWWIGPRANSGSVTPVRDRLFWALRRIQDSLENRHVLIQIWVPIKRDGRQILTTDDQPFSFDCSSQSLASYRDVSTQYQFPTDKNSSESVGLPGRVYLEKALEWTPDVQLFSSDEYPRVGFAHRYNVHGTIALPIFEQGSRSCLGVLEVVTTTSKTKYRSELENICEALEAVDLRSSEVSSSTHIKAWNESNQAALPEILEVLKAVCETYNLPLAQTWVPCIQQGKGGCPQSDENYIYCLSTVDSACCVTDPRIQGFHEACSEHQLLRGQGVVGRALMTNEPCFLSDITSLSKKEYPLVHYAKIFGLRAAVAIRLRSIYSGTIDYVLEFFLPLDCVEFEEQKTMLKSLSIVLQRVCRSLRVVTDEELQVETVSQVGEKMYGLAHGPSKMLSQSTWIAHMMESQQKSIIVQKEETEGFKLKSNWGNPEGVLQQQQNLSSRQKSSVECGEDSSIGEGSLSSAAKPVEKRRTKAEKSISLQVLRQYFAGSLKDAAKSIGVCPTTLKRICRQHGITRWPSRKIKKVGRSLRKLQVVIDSVQGAEGAFQIGSFYTNFPELTSPNIPGSNLFPTMKVNDNLKTVNTESEGVPSAHTECVLSSLATGSKTSSSSCSQTSSSSRSCSSLGKQQTLIADLTDKEDSGMMNVLKRTRSDVELLAKEELGLLKRSQSHKSLSEHPRHIRLAFPKSKRQVSRDRAAIRVKVTYGEERVRLSMPSSWRFGDLQQEIAKRFHIDDMSGIDLKYLDDDSEWVLLTCDADVEECIDVYKTSSAHTIKLSVLQVSHPNLGSFLGSS